MEGRVEVCRGGVWGAVYDNSGWNFNDAKVTCRQLGYPSECELPSMCMYSWYLLNTSSKIICLIVVVVYRTSTWQEWELKQCFCILQHVGFWTTLVTYVTCDNAFTTICWFGNNSIVTSVTCDNKLMTTLSLYRGHSSDWVLFWTWKCSYSHPQYEVHWIWEFIGAMFKSNTVPIIKQLPFFPSS